MKSMLLLPEDFAVDLPARKRTGLIWTWIFQASTVVGVIALATLLVNITNGAFGYVALQARVDPATLAVNGTPLEQQTKEQLVELAALEALAGAFNKLNKEASLRAPAALQMCTHSWSSASFAMMSSTRGTCGSR